MILGESPQVYRAHVLRSGDKILCPILFNHKCEICGATGDRAHTKRHCPQSDGAQQSESEGANVYESVHIYFTDNLRRQQELNAQLSAIARENDEKRRRVMSGKIQGKQAIALCWIVHEHKYI